MDAPILNAMLDKHYKWLNYELGGERAELYGADLTGANLSGANLTAANLPGANLSGVDLSGAIFKRANLCGANLSGTNLCGANLVGANLVGANLFGANFTGVNLFGANLYKANLSGTINLRVPQVCPEEGQFICYKKACIYTKDNLCEHKIVKLLVPGNAKRSSGTTLKCRCSEALVLDILNLDGTKADVDHAGSMYDSSFIYKIGNTVSVENFDENRWRECAPGIHFFMSMNEAIIY